MLAAALLAAAPSAGFELFGIRLWGSREEDDGRVEVIDPLPYTVTISVTGRDEATERAVRNASSLWRDRETPASGRGGLLAKARGDYRRLLATLYDQGYYGPYISIQAAGREVAGLTLADELPAAVPVTILVDPGPRFRFGRAEIVNAPPRPAHASDTVDTPASVGFATGERANATAIGAASALSIEQWRQLSRAKAREAGREVVADHATSRLDAVVTLDPGGPIRYGAITTSGSQRTDPGFILYMTGLRSGDAFDPDDLARANDRLGRLGIFSLIRIEESDDVSPDGLMPINVMVQDRRPRTVGIGATLSTIDGFGVSAYWVHRNLLGRGERLRFDASVDGLGESADPTELDYNLGVTFTRPGVFNPDTSAIFGAVARQLDFDTYRERSVSARVGLSRQFTNRLNGDIYAVVSRARYDDDFGVRHFTTFSLVGSAIYDRRNDPLDATRGYYLAGGVQPFYEFFYDNPAVRGTLEGRAFYPVDADARYVLAGRARVGSFAGPSAAESPPDLLFFTGGGGSVRGYAYRSIGIEVDDLNGKPAVIGGRGLLEASAELRTRFGERFGGVAFVDAGLVTEDPTPGDTDEFRVGAGLGFRYFTGIGPIRVDVATPIDPRPGDSRVALYIGIGQAF